MATGHELLCKPWNRDLWSAWKKGEITFEEAAFLARRVEVGSAIAFFPRGLVDAVLVIYDVIFEPRDLQPPS